ncbi:peptide deformylase [Tumebacillus flagellatus]|uniref:Peptide deformylase n=1 Tax=Tumebacillus flagellatus TaxID=1157490 RepID=A0A074MBW3_9BACL|nr:peptide deformylase [Tumebacillus flagellatus]KEO83392.1 peptide deformylase [Tumebacillus flagellatus]
MAVRPVVLEGEPVLRAVADPVAKNEFNAELFKLLDDMADTMYDYHGIGLAAPQVGISKRVIVVDYGDEYGGLIEMINPVITEKSGSVVDVEGCLSIPGLRGHVERFDKLTIQFQQRDGHTYEMKPEGYFARVFQHEIDHLDGILYTDKAIDTFPVDESEQIPEDEQ